MRITAIRKSTALALLGLAVSAILLVSCPSAKTGSAYKMTNLVSDTAFAGARIDTSLLNAWGIGIEPSGTISVAANHSGQALLYDWSGASAGSAIETPTPAGAPGGAPSGQVYNSTSDFAVPIVDEAGKLIFSTEDGTILVWGSGASAKIGADRSAAGAVYKGLAIGTDGSDNFIYAANFKGQHVDVFDKNFAFVSTKTLSDPAIPAGFGPFNVADIDGKLYVSYAMLKPPDNMDDSAGPGFGYIDIYEPNGTLDKRFYSQGVLNSPWGIARAPSDFGQFADDILVGNFGDGKINAFDSTGMWLGALKAKDSTAISISGLWGITFGVPSHTSDLYFTAGPTHEDHGLFGYITLEP